MMMIVGVDLGQAQDYTALAIVEPVVEPQRQPRLECRHLQRWPRGTRYPQMVADLGTLLQQLAQRAHQVAFETGTPARLPRLLVDKTGVGAAVVDMLRAQDLDPISITIHGGDAVTPDPLGGYRVPKRDLVSAVQVPLQQGRLRFAQGLPEMETLTRELLAFKVTIDPKTAHDSYSAWRERDHDDLVLALALACWGAAHIPAPWTTEALHTLMERRSGRR